MADAHSPKLQSYRFMLLYALAAAGGAIAYVPFLTIVLPARVTVFAGYNDVEWLAYISFAGAISASIGNIVFGWLSDITKNRRGWTFCGLFSSCILLVLFNWTEQLEALIGLMLLWQLALNMMLAPLGAWAGDCVPDHQKGLLGGLLAFSPALGAMSGAIVTIPGLASDEARLWLLAGLVCVCVLPVLFFAKPVHFAELHRKPEDEDRNIGSDGVQTRVLMRMWSARLLLQISQAALFSYLLYWFRSIDSDMGESSTAQVLSFVLIISIPVAMVMGRWTDLKSRPIFPLVLCAGFAAAGLVGMALSSSLAAAVGSYVIFGLATAVFLALHTSQTLRVLPKPERRGRDLGIFNLTNTAPSLIMPWIVLAMVPVFGFPAMLLLFAGLALLSCILLATLPEAR
ncbi:MFS transporter [Sphingorhabdus sp. Alg231-15]|uniref:MFS transporter n=1 Tax=Sphingorhabdus sp. Alg231-15 TaxID=1922222 RepID=UPI00307BCA01